MYKNLTGQTIHYFARPQARVLREPLEIPAAWKGSEMTRRDDWREALTESDIEELDAALTAAKRTSKSMRTLGRDDFPLPTLSKKIDRWRSEITSGRGFQVLTGMPITRWSQHEAETFFWCFGLHFGIPGAQNPQGDLLGHVVDTGESPDEVRHYRTRVNINFHCDAADVVGLLCLKKAKRGGLSRIVSSVSVYNELLRCRPEAVDRFYRPFMMDTKGEGGVQYLPVRPCRYDGNGLRTFYHTDYFRSAVGFRGQSLLSLEGRVLLDLYNEIAGSPKLYLDMDLQPGDIQLLSNHTILHARTDYEDFPEPERKRHLLRLWISLPARAPLVTRLRTQRSRLGMVAVAAGFKLGHAIRRALRFSTAIGSIRRSRTDKEATLRAPGWKTPPTRALRPQ
ncbi:MAG: TauD/TfdA family dioxygenase [Deltaproteobacteria bacterium]|nr:TauD/TfdA family dioxygenase [Deltaproteobacteria bacterium]